MRDARKALLLGFVIALVGVIASAQVSFSKYVAIGDSLTAGYASGALTEYYQDYSFPAILAKQFGISDFQQPIISDPGIGSSATQPTVLQLFQLQFSPTTGVVPVIGPAPGAPGQPINATLPTPYNNLGIPGANTGDLITKTGDITKLLSGNIDPNTIMYDLVLRDGEHTALEEAIGQAPTFITVWAGNNDVLGGATTGVAIDGVTVTSAAKFQQGYTTLIGGLRSQLASAAIIVGTVPDVTTIPFVTTIKPYIVNPADGSHIPLIGEAGPLTESDYVTLGASSLLAQGIGIPAAAGGTGIPLPEGSVDATGLHAGVILRAGEIALLQSRVVELNDIIKAVAAQFGAEVVDFNAILAGVRAHGYMVGGVTLTSDFLTGGIFSYDGIHPQRLGYAIVANEFVKAINAALGTDVPQVNLRPFLTGEGGTTSVMAASAVFSQAAAVSVIRTFAPNALFDAFQTHRTVRRHLSERAVHGPVEPPMP
jgi:lysophospholipase L1-like esterase